MAEKPPPPSHTVTVVDCGSSAIRATIAEIRGDTVRVLEDLDFEADLTRAFSADRLDRHDSERVQQALENIRQAARSYGSDAMRVVATSAFRDAVNADVVIEDIRRRLGVGIEVIDSAEEARLYHEALLQAVHEETVRLGRSVLLLDLGSGSLNVSLTVKERLVRAVNEHLGADRVVALFEGANETPEWHAMIDRYAAGAIRRMLGQLQATRVDSIAITGSEPRELYERIIACAPKTRVPRLNRSRLDAWWKSQAGLTASARARACGCERQHANALLFAASLMRHVMDNTHTRSVLVPDIRLRDGLVRDFLPGAPGPYHLDPEHLVAAAQALIKRYGCDAVYAENTRALAEQLFDQTLTLHHLGGRERLLLSFAALVHDIGAHISVRNRHKHTMYLIRGTEIAGLSEEEKRIVSLVARYHRGSLPHPGHDDLYSLPTATRVLVLQLAAILRIAYGLDVERVQRIRKINARVGEGVLFVEVDRRQVSLEQWSMARKADLFRDVYGLQVQVLPRETR